MFKPLRKQNVLTALRNRSNGSTQKKSDLAPLLELAEKCAATQCTNNRKVELPRRTRTTFMTAVSPNNKLIASCHGDHNIYISDIATGKVVNSLIGHSRSPWCISFHPSSNDILASGCLSGEVRVWDLRVGGSESWMVSENDIHVTVASLSFHPTDHVLLIAAGNEIHFWDWSLPKPFASVKTGSSAERVRLVRFDMFGSKILTGVINFEEEQQNSGTDEDDQDTDNSTVPWGSPIVLLEDSLARRRQLLRNWLRGRSRNAEAPENDEIIEPPEIPPPETIPVRRSPVPLYIRRRQTGVVRSTANAPPSRYNLRSRERGNVPTDLPDDNPSDALGSENILFPDAQPQSRDMLLRSRSLNRLFELRQRMSDLSNSHAYDHQRILHARVSVNAEIQHQYNRLRLLRLERRRLELRLQQLQGRNSTSNPSNNQSAIEQDDSSIISSPDLFLNPVSDIGSTTDPRQVRFLDILGTTPVSQLVNSSSDTSNSPNSTDFTSQGHPLSSAIPSRAGSSESSVLGPRVLSMAGEIAPNLPTMEEAAPSNTPPSRNRTIPSYFQTIRHQLPPSFRPPSSSISRRTTQPPFYFVPGTPSNDIEPTQDFTFTRTSQQRLRLRQSRAAWRRHRRRARYANSMGQLLSLQPEGHNDRFCYRLQLWDFSNLALPEIGRSDANVIVPHCKIYNDSSVDISKDGTKLATFIPTEMGFPESMQVAVYSLQSDTLGQILYRKPFGPHAVCLSLSPLGDYLAVGVKNRPYLSEAISANSSPMAQILKLSKKGEPSTMVNQVMHPVNPDAPTRFVSINTLAWLPGIGDGLLYGTNNGELRICQPAP